VESNVERVRGAFARFNETGEIDEAQLWTFRDNLLARLQAFPTIEEAYAAARALDDAEGVEAPTDPSRAGSRDRRR
jgi:hypothetical protein